MKSIHMTIKPWFKLFLSGILLWMVTSCSESTSEGAGTEMPVLYPDYSGVTIPPNIAPLNLLVKVEGRVIFAELKGNTKEEFTVRSRKGVISIPEKKWRTLLEECRGKSFGFSVFSEEGRFRTLIDSFRIFVAEEPVDPYLVYRLIPPGYETWSYMGLFQRDLTSFREKPIIENTNVEENCVNCHSFNMGNSGQFLYHVRGSLGGTLIRKGDTIRKVNLKRDETLSAGVYPAWHPSGEYIAFSTNKIEQYFHAGAGRDIEVLDRHSDLILYRTADDHVSIVSGTAGDEHMETYPCWSPDGRWLYFSRSDARADTPFDSIRYDIYRIGFDPGTGQFREEAEAVFQATLSGRSASFPRISPDGKYLLCTLHPYGTFPIWHKEADLCLVDLEDFTWDIPGSVNSNDTESFHSWSSNSRWIVFSSRRDDGRYTRSYICYLDPDGNFRQPFLLPQKDPGDYATMIYSYNRPELIKGKVDVKNRKWVRVIQK